MTFLLITGHCATYTIGTCNSSQYFSTVAVSCVACDTTNKKNLTPQGNRCICKAGSIPANSSVNWNQSCTVNATCTGSLPVYQDTDNDGSYLSQIVCVSCADNYTANRYEIGVYLVTTRNANGVDPTRFPRMGRPVPV